MLVTEEGFQAYVESEPGKYPVTNKRWCIIHREREEWSEYFKAYADLMQFNQVDIRYNNLTFNGAADVIGRATVLLSPYISNVLPEPETPQYITPIYEALKPLESIPVDVSGYSLDDMNVFHRLANGWSSKDAANDYAMPAPSTPMYRPSSGLCFPRMFLDDVTCILHPWLPRPITDEEFAAIMKSDFFDYIINYAEHAPVITPLVKHEREMLDWTYGGVPAHDPFRPKRYDSIKANTYHRSEMDATIPVR